MIDPQYALAEVQSSGVRWIDFLVTFVVTVEDHPIFFLEIKPPCNLSSLSEREAADAQMRERFRNLFDQTPIPRLHGVSALGQQLSVYMVDKATREVTPPCNPPSRPRIIDRVAHKVLWAYDVVTPAGYQKLMEVAQDIQQMVAAVSALGILHVIFIRVPC
jgi:hypothetical protein